MATIGGIVGIAHLWNPKYFHKLMVHIILSP